MHHYLYVIFFLLDSLDVIHPILDTLITDFSLISTVTHFAREKIPARNVHALGTGAYGHLRVTNPEISQRYSFAKVFAPGSTTELAVRFSGIFTEQGDPDTTRDPRGFGNQSSLL